MERVIEVSGIISFIRILVENESVGLLPCALRFSSSRQELALHKFRCGSIHVCLDIGVGRVKAARGRLKRGRTRGSAVSESLEPSW